MALTDSTSSTSSFGGRLMVCHVCADTSVGEHAFRSVHLRRFKRNFYSALAVFFQVLNQAAFEQNEKDWQKAGLKSQFK